MNYLNTSTDDIGTSIDDTEYNGSIPNNFFGSQKQLYRNISINNLNRIKSIQSFGLLNKNWDSYNAEQPSYEAITKAITFSLWLSECNVEIFFVAPTPNGDILIEIKGSNASIEFIFSNIDADKVLAWCDGELMSEAILNDTTRNSYIKWLICPNGSCPDF